VARVLVSRAVERSGFTTLSSRAVGAVRSALGVGGRCREIFVLATCPLKFAKAGSAASQPQEEKNNSAELQSGRIKTTGLSAQWQVGPRGNVLSTSLSRWP
jgi:hypothetical protein